MDDFIPWLMGGGVAVLVIGAIAYAYIHERKRTESLKTLADSMGLAFFPRGDQSLVGALTQFHLFSQGGGRSTRNMIHGETEEVDLAILDYSFTTSSGKHQQTHKQSVVFLDSRLLSLPDFAVRPESVFHRLGRIVGWKDINFDEFPKFSKMFWLQGSNEAEVRKLFRADIVRWLEAKPDVCAEGKGSRLIVYRARRRMSPDQIRKFMEEGFELYGLLKRVES